MKNSNEQKPKKLCIICGDYIDIVADYKTDDRQPFIVEGLGLVTLDRPDAVMSEKSVLKTLPSFEKYHKILDWHHKKKNEYIYIYINIVNGYIITLILCVCGENNRFPRSVAIRAFPIRPSSTCILYV